MNLIKAVLMSKVFRLITLAVLALTSLNEVFMEASEMNGFSFTELGAHHGLFLFALATFMKESWEMLEIEEGLHPEHE